MLGMLLFNWYGYRLLANYLENRANEQLVSSLDNNSYDESALISIKVPAGHLAYYNNSQQFERFEGQIEIQGFQYNFVKRRLYNDSIEMLCIPNHVVTQLKKDKNDFFNLVNDLQRSGQNKKPDSHVFKSFSAEYYADIDHYILKERFNNHTKSAFYYYEILPTGLSSADERPPQATA